MNRTRLTLLAAVFGVGYLLFASNSNSKPVAASPVKETTPEKFGISGPYTHDNLTVYLLHGPDTLPERPIMTLDEALAAGKAIVKETGTVSELCVENLSDDTDLMIQNGDIVKGGKQDRVLRVAMIVQPKSGPMPIDSFCVEAGRWTNRGNEAVASFASNPGQIAGKDLKLAANGFTGGQGEVWKNVEKVQGQLTMNNATKVNSDQSPTSYQLATENKELQANLNAYKSKLGDVVRGKYSAIGYVIAVNGKVTSADIYGSSVLLKKAWPKAIASAATEAFAEKTANAYEPCTTEMVKTFLADAGKANDVAIADGKLGSSYNAEIQIIPLENLGSVIIRGNNGNDIENPLSMQLEQTRGVDNTVINGRSASTRNRLVQQGGGQQEPATLSAERIQEMTEQANKLQEGDPSREVIMQLIQRNRRIVEQQGIRSERETMFYQNLQQPMQQAGTQIGNNFQPQSQAGNVQVNRTIGKGNVMVESRDNRNPSVIIHRTLIAK